jgi:FtsH-binding integral membrane protein
MTSAHLAQPLVFRTPVRSFASKVYQGEVITDSPFTARGREVPPETKTKYALLGGAGLVALGTILFAGASTSSAEATKSANEASVRYPGQVRSKLASAYGYFGLCIVATGVAAAAASRSPALLTLAATRPMVFGIGGFVGVMGTMILTRSIDFQASPNAKRLALLSFAAFQGITLLPIAFVGGAIVSQAAMATAAMVGSLAAVASVAPSESFLWMAGPLTIGLGVVFAASLGGMFFPGSAILYNVSLYGGLALFGGFTLYDVQKMSKRAEIIPETQYDPVNECIHLYMNTINIFIRFVQIFSNMNGNNKRR